jgi:hypothetical protein
MHVSGQSAVRAWSWLRLAIRSAVTQMGGSGSVSVLPSAFEHLLVSERMTARRLTLETCQPSGPDGEGQAGGQAR